MGTLGPYLKSAREAKDIDIRDAAQQTRIRIDYLKALEAEDFSKLPGEVFTRGFLKNYARFLNLDETETLKRYAELKPVPPPSAHAAAAAGTEKKFASPEAGTQSKEETPIEPFVWGAVIFISLLVFLFTSLPGRHSNQTPPGMPGLPISSTLTLETSQSTTTRSDKLYLEVVALEDTWLLVRTDTSPQKKAVLKKGESLIWSADERFLLSYASVGDVKLLLNGEELTVRGSGPMPIRDLAVTRAGVINQPAPAKQPLLARPKPKQAVRPVQTSQPLAEPQAVPAAVSSPSPAQASASKPASEPAQTPAPVPTAAPTQAAPAPVSAATPAPSSAIVPGQAQ